MGDLSVFFKSIESNREVKRARPREIAAY